MSEIHTVMQLVKCYYYFIRYKVSETTSCNARLSDQLLIMM